MKDSIKSKLLLALFLGGANSQSTAPLPAMLGTTAITASNFNTGTTSTSCY